MLADPFIRLGRQSDQSGPAVAAGHFAGEQTADCRTRRGGGLAKTRSEIILGLHIKEGNLVLVHLPRHKNCSQFYERGKTGDMEVAHYKLQIPSNYVTHYKLERTIL
jgi:hypothetical protein